MGGAGRAAGARGVRLYARVVKAEGLKPDEGIDVRQRIVRNSRVIVGHVGRTVRGVRHACAAGMGSRISRAPRVHRTRVSPGWSWSRESDVSSFMAAERSFCAARARREIAEIMPNVCRDHTEIPPRWLAST